MLFPDDDELPRVPQQQQQQPPQQPPAAAAPNNNCLSRGPIHNHTAILRFELQLQFDHNNNNLNHLYLTRSPPHNHTARLCLRCLVIQP